MPTTPSVASALPWWAWRARRWPSCFCTSLGGAPDDNAGMDVML